MAGEEGGHPPIPFLPFVEGFGWPPELRSLVTAVLEKDQKWANIVIADMERKDIAQLLLIAVSLLATVMQVQWDVSDDEARRLWARLSVQLDQAGEAWRGEAIGHPFDVLGSVDPPAEDPPE